MILPNGIGSFVLDLLDSVTRFSKNTSVWPNFKSLAYFEAFLIKNSNLFGQIFNDINGQILNK